MRLLLTLAGLAIGFSVPAFSQEPKPVDPEVRQEIEAVLMKFDEAFNKRDTAAIAALYTHEAVQVLDEWEGSGTISGQQAIEKLYTSEFASTPAKFVSKLVQVSPLADELAVNSEFTCPPWKGFKMCIYTRDVDTWKIRLEYAILSMMPR